MKTTKISSLNCLTEFSVSLTAGLLCLGLVNGATFSVSPSAISNTYSGYLTLQIGGLTNREMVIIQKFADVNTNGVVDPGDWPIQQFSLQDGGASVIGGVTNINVPHDATPVDGVITAALGLPVQGIVHQFVGKYLYRLSSPAGGFVPVTNLFTVTNFPFAQSFSGKVDSNGTNVPYAGVILFTASANGEGLGRPVAGTVANSSGSYALKSPPGTYVLWAFRNGYVADVFTSPALTMSAGATIVTNLNLLPGTRTISGRVVDAATNSIGLPGILVAWSSTAGQLAVHFTDPDGGFTSSVTPGQWEFGGDDASFSVLGYLELENWPQVNTTTGNVANVTIGTPKATALLHGSVKDDLDHPLPGVALYGVDNEGNGTYAAYATTDPNGNYVLAINAGVWAVEVDKESSNAGSFVFSPTRSTNSAFTDGLAQRQDFTGFLATNSITGYVRDAVTTLGLANVGVPAWATINGASCMQYARTGPDGFYSMQVANGSWSVAVNCHCDYSDCLGPTYQCPGNQLVLIAGNDGVANFLVQPVALRIVTTSLLNGMAGAFYQQLLMASGGQPPYHWSLQTGSAPLPPGLELAPDGVIFGTCDAPGTFPFIVHLADATSAYVDQPLQIIVHPRPALSFPVKPSVTQFRFQVQGVAGQNYTVQGSSNLVNWNSIFVTNAPTDAFTVILNRATNSLGFFRVLLGP